MHSQLHRPLRLRLRFLRWHKSDQRCTDELSPYPLRLQEPVQKQGFTHHFYRKTRPMILLRHKIEKEKGHLGHQFLDKLSLRQVQPTRLEREEKGIPRLH